MITQKSEQDINFLHEKVTNILETSCGCVVDLYNITAACTMAGNLIVRGVVSSSNQSNTSASTAVDMLQVWLLTSTASIVVTIAQQSFNLNKQCPLRINLASPNMCENISSMDNSEVNQQTQETCFGGGVMIGSFVGGMVAGILTCVIIFFTGIW